jgi:uncharacterized membrane protein YuzA (DUF378 family)
MATMNAPTIDRRQLPERRTSSQRSAMSTLDYLAMALLIVGGLNWAAVGLANVDIVASIFGEGSPVTRLVYALVGLAALYAIFIAAKMSTSKRTA